MYASQKFSVECKRLLESALGKGFFRENKSRIKLENPPRGVEADLALPCFAISFGKNPSEFASELAEKVNKKIKKGSIVHKAEPVGPYMNFVADSTAYSRIILDEILSMKSRYGSEKPNHRTVIIDFSSPNIAKPMNIGHLRSTIIGQSLYNIYSFLGYKCIGDNHVGDWGTQFGKLMAAYKMWGDAQKLKESGVEYLTQLYVRFHEEEEKDECLSESGREWFHRLESGDKEAKDLWKLFYGISMKEFGRIYELLNVHFDLEMGESRYYKDGLKIVKALVEKKIAEESEGAVIIKFDALPPLVIQKSDESTLYSTRDLACVKYRGKFRPEKIVYVIGSEQKLYMKQLFEAARKMGFRSDFVHVDFGLYTMEGEKMSTRKGRFVLLDDLIGESLKRAEKIIQDKNPTLPERSRVARVVGIGAIIFNDLKQERIKGIDFAWERVLNFEGDSCPYLQYSYVRTRSILEKAKRKEAKKTNVIIGAEEARLSKKLAEFPQVVESAAFQYKPNLIAQYLLDVAAIFSEFYSKNRVIGSENEKTRIMLVEATGITLKNGLKLLNIDVPEKM